MITPNNRGGSVSVQKYNPSIDLCSLIECLNKAIPAISDSENKNHSYPLVALHPEVQQSAIVVNLEGVLSRLTKLLQEESCQALEKFIRDLEIPQLGQRAWYGGQIVEGTEDKLTKALEQLVESIDAELNSLFQGEVSPTDLLISNPAEHLDAIAKKFNLNKSIKQLFQGKIKLHPIRLETQPNDPPHNKGRVFSSTESIEGNREIRLQQLIQACHTELEIEGLTVDDIKARCEELRYKAEPDFTIAKDNPQNQFNRFLKFLDDTALARVRLAIGFNLLNSLAHYLSQREKQANLPQEMTIWQLVEYVQRVQAFFDYFTGEPAPLIELDLSASFPGMEGLLDEEAVKIEFYNALPIFPEPNAQLFEQHDEVKTIREVSYRFRINGNNPETRESAFMSRLERIRANLSNPDKNSRRDLLQLILLWAVIPTNEQQDFTQITVRNHVEKRIQQILAILRDQGKEGALELLEKLKEYTTVVDIIAKALIYALQQKGSALAKLTDNPSHIFYLNVRPGVINSTQLAGNMNDILSSQQLTERSRPNHEQIHFFKHIKISQNVPQVDALMSFKIEVILSESYLVTVGEINTFKVKRSLPIHLVQVWWLPSEVDSELYREFIQPRRIVFSYENKFLQSKKNDDKSIQLVTAYRTAFTILSYVITLRLLRRIAIKPETHVLVLRLQTEGQGKSANDAAINAVYAASQAYEHLLNRDYPCRLQGLVVKKDNNLFYRKRNAFYALCAGFPLAIDDATLAAKSIKQVGVITFTNRPSNVHPRQDKSQYGFTLVMRSYLLEQTATGYIIKNDSMRVSLVTGEDKTEHPELVMNEIRRLQVQGVQHIIYLAQRAGDRRRGRSHPRERLYDDANFLNQLYQTFSDVVLYPLVREVFPSVRLEESNRTGVAYEINQVGLKGYRLPKGIDELRANYIPVYSIGTLRIVGKEDNKKPQSGICTYFLLNDLNLEDDERMQRIRSHLLLSDYGGRADLLMALRAIHFLENEENQIRPVLDPYRWLSPDSLEQAGDIPIYEEKTRYHQNKPVVLSLRAVLARIADILHKTSL
ncbi:MAG: hypothetical protein HC877_08045 [Thioploca sp.]|nr:hypothetical protein [Thioploca sp.]